MLLTFVTEGHTDRSALMTHYMSRWSAYIPGNNTTTPIGITLGRTFQNGGQFPH